MSRRLAVATLAGLMAAGSAAPAAFAQSPAEQQAPPSRPPWSSLTSPSAALRVVLDEICLPAILETRPLGPLAESRYLRPVAPRSTGSAQAVAAWRLASWHEIFVMQLPNGGCSLSLEAGDADDLAALAVTMLQARVPFEEGQSMPSADGDATNTAWCTADADRPVVAGIVRRTRGRRVALLINLFRAQGPHPAFCASPA